MICARFAGCFRRAESRTRELSGLEGKCFPAGDNRRLKAEIERLKTQK